MRWLTLLSLLSASALAQSTNDTAVGQLDCPVPGGAHIIACSGHGGFPHDYGLLQSLLDGILGVLPAGSNNYSIPYPKKDDNRPEGVAQGVVLLTDNIQQYTEACPNVPIILIGYSEGAIVTSNTLCGRSHKGAPFSAGIPAKYNEIIIATVLYGDETYISGQPQDRGTCTMGHGVNPRQNPDGCKPFQPDMRQWCDKPDPQCCGGNRNSSHFQYPDKYNDVAIPFVQKKFQQYVKNFGSSQPPGTGGGGNGGGNGGGGSGGGGNKGGKGGKGGKKGGKGGKKKKCGLLGGILGSHKCHHRHHKGKGGGGGGGGGGGH